MTQPPKLAELLVRLVVDDDSVIGDLRERFGTDHLGYWKEAMAMVPYGIHKRLDAILAIALGVAAGVGLVVSMLVSHRGPYTLFIYAGLVLAVALELGFTSARRYVRHFRLSLTAFCIALAIQYVALQMMPGTISVSFWGHAWRIGLLVAIGTFASAIGAAFSRFTPPAFLLFPFVPAAIYLWFFVTRGARPQLLRFVLPYGLVVNWRHDGWGWAFAGLDVVMWTMLGLLLFSFFRTRRTADAGGR